MGADFPRFEVLELLDLQSLQVPKQPAARWPTVHVELWEFKVDCLIVQVLAVRL